MIDAKEERADLHGRRTEVTQESQLVQRVLATPAFARSVLLTNFLLYVCDCKFNGHDEEITEYQVGVQALGRPESFNPGEDNIVRNYARILRKRLEEYFTGEGRDEALRIVIPRGHYIPVFEPNSTAPSVFSAKAETQDSSNISLDSAAMSGAAKAAAWYGMRRLWIFAVLLLAVCIGASIYLRHRAQSPHISEVFWREIFEQSRATYLVPGDSGFAMLQDITGTELHLDDYIAGDLEEKFPDFNLTATREGAKYGSDRFSNYISTADLSIVLGIVSRAQSYEAQLQVRYARDMHMEDIKRSNVILLGGPHANPWTELFEPESNFRMFFPMHLNGMHVDERSFINKHPRAGEQPTYANLADDSSRRTYALISFLPGADGLGHALLLEGQNMAGTLAAGDFLLNQRAMEPILKKAQLPDGSIGPFEVLVEARTVGANAPEAHVVVERFGIAKAAE